MGKHFRNPNISALLCVWEVVTSRLVAILLIWRILAGDKEKPPEVIDYRKEWQRRLLQRLSQPDVPGLAGMEGLEHDAGLALQAAAVLGVRQSVIESAISKFSALRQAQQI